MSLDPFVDQERERIVEIFSAEARESLAVMEEAVLALRARPADVEALGTLFREAHTIKGNASALDLTSLVELAHVLEDLLDRHRGGSIPMTPRGLDLLLEGVDALGDLMDLSLSGSECATPDAVVHLIEQLSAAARGEGINEDSPTANQTVTPALPENRAASKSGPALALARKTLRIDVERLDAMLSLTGEIAVARSRVRRLLIESTAGSVLRDTHLQLDRLSAELQELVLKIRMLPLGPLFQPLRRTAREAARACGKTVAVEMTGEGVEADTSVLERLRDPLTHLIRNAVDHGLETTEERLAAGKPAEGRLRLSARHEGGGLVVEVEDDGRGLNRDLLLQTAQRRGLLRDGQRLTGEEIDSLIFESGFSTASEITHISGRGVGMDVVRRSVLALRGSLGVHSVLGQGTKFTIRLPLTLAIIPGFEVSVAGDAFVIPMESVVECVALPDLSEESGVMNLRGEALPYLSLANHFGLPSPEGPRRLVVVVVSDASRRAGLAVDSLRGQTQAVLRPLGRSFRGIPGLSGATIGDDGRVGHILDVPVLLRRAEDVAQALAVAVSGNPSIN